MSGGTAMISSRLAAAAALAWGFVGLAAPGGAADPAAPGAAAVLDLGRPPAAGELAAQIAALPGYLAVGMIRAGPGPIRAVTLDDVARDHVWRRAATRRLERLFGAPRTAPRRPALFLP